MLSRFNRIPEPDGQTGRRTDSLDRHCQTDRIPISFSSGIMRQHLYAHAP